MPGPYLVEILEEV